MGRIHTGHPDHIESLLGKSRAPVESSIVEPIIEKKVEPEIIYVDRVVTQQVEIPKVVIEYVDRPVEVIKDVERVVEVPKEIIKYVEQIVEKPIEIIKEIENTTQINKLKRHLKIVYIIGSLIISALLLSKVL